MQNLLKLLQELKVPNIEPKIMIVPIDKSNPQEDYYQLQLDLNTRKNNN
ncbi:hypothetical protein [Bacillus sp. HMF5848]|nr:hypothetical protein [Bacillus sp. HMF5848]